MDEDKERIAKKLKEMAEDLKDFPAKMLEELEKFPEVVFKEAEKFLSDQLFGGKPEEFAIIRKVLSDVIVVFMINNLQYRRTIDMIIQVLEKNTETFKGIEVILEPLIEIREKMVDDYFKRMLNNLSKNSTRH